MYLLIDAPDAGRYADPTPHQASRSLSVPALPLLAGVSLAKLGMGRSR
jgi:hypothetical protein